MSGPVSDSIRFLLGGRVVEVRDIPSTRTVLQYLRQDLRRTGAKEGCAEGDCGACTVVIGELDGDALQMRAVNACIRLLPTLDGKALYTVEDLRGVDGGLHPVQRAMVECHGSQCGFCTPGFVMSLWSAYLEQQCSDAQLRTALSGNLCRCTGYRRILEAGRRMFDLPDVPFDTAAVREALMQLRRSQPVRYAHNGQAFHTPRTVEQLLRLRAAYPQATILAGGTDIGLWVNKLLRDLGDIIYIGEVGELKTVHEDDGMLRIGAGVSLTDALRALTRHYPQAAEQHERFASVPIRNAGTLGGNVANGSPIGDSMPWLIVLGAKVVLRDTDGERTIPLEELYIDYMRKSMTAAEIVTAIEVPLPPAGQRFRTYKLSKRYDSDISAVCAAFAISGDGRQIDGARVSFGGMAATPTRARHCEAALTGQTWSQATVRAAMQALSRDYAPLSDMRASAANRMQSAQNLLYRFYLETRADEPLPAEAVSVFASHSGGDHD